MRTRLFTSLMIAAVLWPGVARAALYVSGFSDGRILRFDESTGAALGVFVTAGSGGLSAPHRSRFGPDGRLYVASANNDSVLRYDGTTGAFVDAFIANGGGGLGANALDYPVDLIFRGGRLYVTSQLNDSVKRYDATTGAFVDSFVPGGSGGLGAPSGMVFAPNGDLYVVGRSSNLVHRYNGATGAPVGSLGAGNLAQPFGIAVGADGTLYVASGNTNTIARFNSITGAFLGNLSTVGTGLGLPIGVELGPDGSVYTASFNSGVVKRFNATTGAFLGDFAASSPGATLSGPNFLTFATPGAVPAVTAQPVAGSVLAGGAASFTAAFSGTPAPVVQWQISMDAGVTWSDLANDGPITGAQSGTLAFAFVSQTLHGAQVRAAATNAGGTVLSDAVTLSVDAGTARLGNVSARAFVGTGAQVVIPGTVIQGTGTRRLLVRAAGPGLGVFGVPGVLVDPVLEVRRADNSLVASNDNWSAGTSTETAALSAAMALVQAFPLAAGSADAALLVELPAGAYTFVVSGSNNATGVALIEVYEMP